MNIKPPAVLPRASGRVNELQIWGLVAIVLIACWPISDALWHYWADDHLIGGRGAFVTALGFFLLYRARGRIAAARVRRMPWVLSLLVACSIATVIFWKAGMREWAPLMLPTLILVGALSTFGIDVTRLIAVPIGFLYFALPAWDDLLGPPLQALTLWVVKWVAPVIGVPASVSGSLISLPGDMTFVVAQGCSGVGFLVEGLTVAALLGELEQAPLRRRVVLLASMIPVALVANWFRVLVIVQVGYSTGMRHVLVTRHHLLFGYAIFVLVLILFLWVATWRTSPSRLQLDRG
jgi:exosortase